MKKAIRCCISCILPCGALDVIRIVHSNGRVEEISGTVKAAEIMKLHPKHVLKKPSYSSASDQGMRPKIAVVPPEADLKRGRIYFLMPLPPPPPEKSRARSTEKRKGKELSGRQQRGEEPTSRRSGGSNNLLISDRYLSEILSERISSQRERRRGRAGVWRPHLDSISEIPVEA